MEPDRKGASGWYEFGRDHRTLWVHVVVALGTLYVPTAGVGLWVSNRPIESFGLAVIHAVLWPVPARFPQH